ncbi:hypothetical protein C1708_07800 [Streptomyces sp. DH-12]|uniref:hypothetical protein n=1 Tax=unclassified Streptomyces TaxID=2593676 RepID=UPI000CCDF18F|nr:hypothetical protein [Streptomyces sp. DH-12]PNV32208.1 hypothetical protein C1708_07800 [Streptomyces sp. DH-12]
MEPVAAELLMALASGTAGAAGQNLWERLRSLAQRSPAREPDAGQGDGEAAVGELVTALDEDASDEERAARLAEGLALRARQDPAFAEALALWRREAEQLPGASSGGGAQHQEISGGTQHNVVFTRDVHGSINLG